MTTTIERSIRCSSLPRVLKCPASQVKPVIRIEDDSEPARLGSAVHQVLAAWIEADATNVSEIDTAAAHYRVDRDEVAPLCWNGWRCWQQLKPMFPDASVEIEMESTTGELRLTGHADVTTKVDEQIRGVDWKTGREDSDYIDQMKGYGYLALQYDRAATSVYFAIAWLREQEVEGFVWTRDELNAWHDGIEHRLARDDVYNPGRHCGFCPRRNECATRFEATSTAIASIVGERGLIPLIQAGDFLDLYDRIKIAESAIKMADDLLRAEVEARGGQLSDGSRTLTLHEITIRRINAAPAWPILTDRFGTEVVLGAARLSKEAVEQMAKDAAPPRQKGKHAAALLAELDAAGAVTTTVSKRLECKRNVSSPTAITGNPSNDRADDELTSVGSAD